MGELDVDDDTGVGEREFEEISMDEEYEENKEGHFHCDLDDENIKYTEKFGSVPDPGIGCFGAIVMYLVHKKHAKVRKNNKSFISRNQRFKRGVNHSMKKLKERTISMMSIASTNWKSSRMHLAESMTSLSMKTRHNSKADSLPARTRHMSMQDRLEMYNEELDSDKGNDKVQPRVRKVSKVAFEAPTELQPDNTSSPATNTHIQVPATRTRKVSKMSMFEFVPEEQEKEKTKARPTSVDMQPTID